MEDLLSLSMQPAVNARNLNDILYLKDFWKDTHCVLFFLRRLGCSVCRAYIKMIEAIRLEYEQKGIRMICISFEGLGQGSDEDRSFEKGGYWRGPIYIVEKDVYAQLFGRKGLMNGFFGLLDMNKEALARAKNVSGNLKGDGFQLGGQFIVEKGGLVILDHRQKVYGDDASLDTIVKTLDGLL